MTLFPQDPSRHTAFILAFLHFIDLNIKTTPNRFSSNTKVVPLTQECESGEATFAEEVISGEELKAYTAAVNSDEMHTTKKQVFDQTPSFKAAQETKKVDLKEGDSSKQVSIGSGMEPK